MANTWIEHGYLPHSRFDSLTKPQMVFEGEHTINYVNNNDSGYIKELNNNMDFEAVTYGLTDKELKNQPRTDDETLDMLTHEAEQEKEGYVYFNPDNSIDHEEFIIQGNKAYERDLKKYNKANKVKTQETRLKDVYSEY